MAIPYSAYSFQLADWYWLGMSLFVPTPRLLAKLHYEMGAVYELMEYCFEDKPPGPCEGCFAPGWNATTSGHPSEPGEIFDSAVAAEQWFGLFWIYTVPHINYFSGASELAAQLMRFSAADARRAGRRLRARNQRVLAATRLQWHSLLTAMLMS